MANAAAGYIIIKGAGDGEKVKKQGIKAFYGPLDKGSAKPSFCYPTQKEELRKEIDRMERSLSDGYVAENRRLKVRSDIKMKKERLDGIEAQEADARKLFKANEHACIERRNELAEIIKNRMPAAKDVEKKKVNPHRIYQDEKRGGFGKLKQEYQILSHLAGEESNTHFLQRD